MSDRLPPGFREVAPNVFEGPARRVGPGVYRGLVRVVLGAAGDDHNCDAMGCGSASDHVLIRETIPGFERGPYFAEDYEVPRV